MAEKAKEVLGQKEAKNLLHLLHLNLCDILFFKYLRDEEKD